MIHEDVVADQVVVVTAQKTAVTDLVPAAWQNVLPEPPLGAMPISRSRMGMPDVTCGEREQPVDFRGHE